MNQLTFIPVTDSTYSVNLPQDHVDYLNKIITDLTLGDNNKWEPFILDAFIDHVVVHYVSRHFFKDCIDAIAKGHMFILIDITYEKRVITASLGLFKIEETQEVRYVAGVMYK